jgi:hypothetical protein
MGRRKLLIVVVAGLALCGCGGTSSGHISGRWGALITCLKDHPLFAVYAAGSGSASEPTSRTSALDVWQSVKGVDLGYVGNNAMGADDVTGIEAASVNLVDGPIHFGFTAHADVENRFDIENCVQRAYESTPSASSRRAGASKKPAEAAAYGGVAPNANYGPATDQSGCPGAQITVGPDTSCGFADHVSAIVATAHRTTGHLPAFVTASSPATGRTYRLRCSILGYGSELVCSTLPPATGVVVIPVKAPATTAPPTTAADQSVPESAISAVAPALSLIFCGGGTSPVGEAFTVRNALVTANDLVTACGTSGITAGSQALRVSEYDDAHDLAALAPAHVSAQATLETAPPQAGQQVVLVGDFPGTSSTLTAAVEEYDYPATMELPGGGSSSVSDTTVVRVRGDMPLGNIGGPAIDAAGKVVGVVIGYNSATHEAFLAPASDVAALAG